MTDKIVTGAGLWQEDECAPDAEDLASAWQRLFGVAFDKKNALRVVDDGDAFIYEMVGGYIAVETAYRSDGIYAPPRHVPYGYVQGLKLEPGKDPVVFDVDRGLIPELKPAPTNDHHHGMFSHESGAPHYARGRSANGTLYILGPYGQGLEDDYARELIHQYSYTPKERLEWAAHRFAEGPFDRELSYFVYYSAREAYGVYGNCAACQPLKSPYVRRHETKVDPAYGFDLGQYEYDVCLKCGDTLAHSGALLAQEQRRTLRALRTKTLNGNLLIRARKTLMLNREALAKALSITSDDIVDWEERDKLDKAPVEWFINQLAKTGVWG